MASRTRLPPPKKKKHRITQPTTADEYLAVGVEHEEAAEKWRAGDAEKALRFYARALETYEQALGMWPGSFDLAYNKARIQYAVTQHPGTKAHLQIPLEQQLRIALESHQAALKLAPKNADVVFNTAQVYSSLAEELDEEDAQATIIAYHGEAIELLQRCLELQADSLRRRQAELDMANQADDAAEAGATSDDPSHDAGETESPPTESSEQWATIIEPITASTLFETGTTIFSTLTSLCEQLDPTQTTQLRTIEQVALKIRQKLDALELEVEEFARTDLLLSEARLKAAMLDAAFESGTLDLRTYDQGLKGSLSPFEAGTNPGALSLYAQSLLQLARSAEHSEGAAQLRWNRTSKALELLGKAVAHTRPEEAAPSHMLRGDIELFRYRLSFDVGLPESLKTAVARRTLLANAEKYYRGAVASGQRSGQRSDEEAAREAAVKIALVECTGEGSLESLEALTSRGVSREDIEDVVQEASEGLLIPPSLVGLL